MKPTLPVMFVLFLCLWLFTAATVETRAATLTVTKTADTNDGACDADCSLREAVAASASGDTVVFSPLFDTPQTITLTLGRINITQNLTITGTGQDFVTISGNNTSLIFLIWANGVTVYISGMTFRDGNGESPTIGIGGAVRVIGSSTLNVSNATFTNNRSGSQSGGGGAIHGSEESILILSNLFIVGNFSRSQAILGYSIDIRDSIVRQNTGWGIESGNFARIERCIISDNSGAGAAAQHLTIIDSTVTNNPEGGVLGGDAASTLTIERCLISGNSRFPGGGGINASGLTIIKDTQITNNIALADYGGGIANLGTLYLINSVVSGNRNTGGSFGDDGGGGILTFGENFFLVNSTVGGNTALGNPGVGGGIYVFANGLNNGRLTVINSTISNNQSREVGGAFEKIVQEQQRSKTR